MRRKFVSRQVTYSRKATFRKSPTMASFFNLFDINPLVAQMGQNGPLTLASLVDVDAVVYSHQIGRG